MTVEPLSAIPMFSILVAAYQAETTIGETLDSLLAQRSTDWEAVIVDDGSSDSTAAIATQYAARDPRFVVQCQENRGTAQARNEAAAKAQGRWLLPLDSDDMLLPDALQAQVDFMEAHLGFDLYSFGTDRLLPDGSREPFDSSPEYARETSFTLADMVDRNRLLAHTVISSELMRRLGGYRDVYVEDYDIWLRAMVLGARHIHNPEVLAIYRSTIASKNADIARSYEGTARVLHDLVATPGIPREVARLAEKRARWYGGTAARLRLEDNLSENRFAGARRAYWEARSGYSNLAVRWVGLVVVLISPRALASLLDFFRRRQTPAPGAR